MLNDAKIKAAKGQDKAYKLTDSGQLYLLVKPTGARLWRMNYAARETPGGPLKQKSLMFGTYPSVTLLQARRFAVKISPGLRASTSTMMESATSAIASRVSPGPSRLIAHYCARARNSQYGNEVGNGRQTEPSLSCIFKILMAGSWRSGRDSNPGYAFGVYSLSRRAPSTTRPPLRMHWNRARLAA
jgi:hypothetical protein